MQPLTEKDVPAILDLIHRAMPSLDEDAVESLASGWENRIMAGGYWIDGSICAMTGIYRENGRAYISWTAVDPEAQGKCNGKILMDWLLEQTKGEDLYVETYTRPEFARANAFYIRHGFVIDSFDGDTVIYVRKAE